MAYGVWRKAGRATVPGVDASTRLVITAVDLPAVLVAAESLDLGGRTRYHRGQLPFLGSVPSHALLQLKRATQGEVGVRLGFFVLPGGLYCGCASCVVYHGDCKAAVGQIS